MRDVRWIGLLGAVALALIGVPTASAAPPQHAPTDARTAATVAVTYGGVTAQDWPVVIELSRSRRQVIRATIGLHLECTSGMSVNVPDSYDTLKVSRRGKFAAGFGPQTIRNDDGTTTDFAGSMRGALNRARTKISGTWQFTATDHDATGAVTDTCDSGTVRWTAKQ